MTSPYQGFGSPGESWEDRSFPGAVRCLWRGVACPYHSHRFSKSVHRCCASGPGPFATAGRGGLGWPRGQFFGEEFVIRKTAAASCALAEGVPYFGPEAAAAFPPTCRLPCDRYLRSPWLGESVPFLAALLGVVNVPVSRVRHAADLIPYLLSGGRGEWRLVAWSDCSFELLEPSF